MPKCVILTAPRTVKVVERKPLIPEPHEAVVAVETAGICGTDLAIFSGDYPRPLPMVLGHEFIGRVTSVGEGADESWVGRRVAAEINNTCVAHKRHILCHACSRGTPNHCQTRTVTGIVARDGAFAEEVAVAEGTLHEIPENLDPFAATLIEPLAAALQTFVMTPVTGKETVAVLGPGRLGILVVFVAALKGLRVVAVSRSEDKRHRALKYGAQEAFAPEEARERILELTHGWGADIVVDSTGRPEGITEAISLVSPQGVVAMKTTCGLPLQGLNATQLVIDEIRLQGSRCGPFPQALEILAERQDRLKYLVSSMRPLEKAQDALESAFTEHKVVFRASD